MALFHIFQFIMTADAQFVNRFIQLELVIAGMGVVAGSTAAALDYSMGVKADAFSLGEFLVSMTADTEI